MRALAAVERDDWRLWGRGLSDYTARYPELAVLRRLPAGTVVDGELVVVHQGRPDLPALLRRHQRRTPLPLDYRGLPLAYVLFDLLCYRGQGLENEALVRRRTLLRDLLNQRNDPLLVYSEGVTGCGRAFFAQVVAQGHEGVMAKRRAGRYEPGKRSWSWRKIKPAHMLPCVVVGYKARREVHRLWLATVREGVLRYVGQLCGSWDAKLLLRLAALRRSRRVVPGAAYFT